jgi:hypothetical protein
MDANNETQIISNNNNNNEFVNNIKQWVTLDSQLKIVNEKTRIMRETKAELNSKICSFVNDNSINHKHIEISDGTLKFYKRKEYEPLTYGYLEKSLQKIIPNQKHIEHILTHLKENRGVVVHDDIRRNYSK